MYCRTAVEEEHVIGMHFKKCRPVRYALALAAISSIWMATSLPGCSVGGGGQTPIVATVDFTTIAGGDVLTNAEANSVVVAAIQAIGATTLANFEVAVAVTDRVGNILQLYNSRGDGTGDPENEFAVSIARTAAYLSHSQAPLTSRTGQFISTFHFPSVFDTTRYIDPCIDQATGLAIPGCTGLAPRQPTTGIKNTPQGPLWQIDISNRGAINIPPIPQLTNSDGSRPTPGLTPLPGGIPLYKNTTATACADPNALCVGRRLVGAVGVYVADLTATIDMTSTLMLPFPDLAEFAAVQGAKNGSSDFFFNGVPNAGGVFLVGILLPFINPQSPIDPGTGVYNAGNEVINTGDGAVDPFGDLVAPANSASAVPFTAAEVTTILDAVESASQDTHAAIRLPAQSQCKMIISICDVDGVLLGVRREDDATLFSLEISISKARNAVYFSDPASRDTLGPNAGNHPLFPVFSGPGGDAGALAMIDGIGIDLGIAVTARSLGFLTQPFFPPTIEGGPVSPLFPLLDQNKITFEGQGFEAPTANRSGIIFFPGSAPIYRGNVLVGGIGVSGDGVDQDDFVTFEGLQRAKSILAGMASDLTISPPPGVRIDNYEHLGVRVPFIKFPQNPGG